MLWSAVLFVAKPMTRYLAGVLKIGRSMAIVAETERIPNRRNSPLNSRAQISDGSGETVPYGSPKDFLLLDQCVTAA